MSSIRCLCQPPTSLCKPACSCRLPDCGRVCLQYKLFAHPANSHNSPDSEHDSSTHSTMSYHQRQREATTPTAAPCQYRHWWRERRLRSDRQRGRSAVRSASIPPTPPPAMFDPEPIRLNESPRRVNDLENGPPHSQFEGSLRSNITATSISSTSVLLLEKEPPLHHQNTVPKLSLRIIRNLRYTVFAVYQRLFTLILIINLIAVFIVLQYRLGQSPKALDLANLATLASSNILLAIVFRQDWIINLLFRSAWIVPWSLPLRLRRIVSRVYCYGGIHSGAAVMGTIWWLLFTARMSWEGVTQGNYTP